MADNTNYLTLTENNFHNEVLKSLNPILVYFWSLWRGPCSMLTPLIMDLAADVEKQTKIGKLNIDDNTSIAKKYSIYIVPTLLFFRDGQVVDKVHGIVPKQILADKLNALFQQSYKKHSL